MSFSNPVNNFLIRCPLSGYGLIGYDRGYRGEIGKILCIASKITLLVISSLSMLHVVPPALSALSTIGISVLSFISYAGGSGKKRVTEGLCFELLIQSISIATSVLSLNGILSQMDMGIAIISTVSGGIIISIFFEKDRLRHLDSHPQEEGLILSEDIFSSERPIWPLRVIDKVTGLGKDLTYGAKNFLTSWTHSSNYSDQIDLKTDSKGLCVFIHGLNGKPAAFDDYHDAMQTALSQEVTIFQPNVTKKGNCTLEEAASNIYSEVAKWAKENPDKPIVITGVSNGARIASYIAAKMKEQNNQNPIQTHCIAGPLLGSKIVNQPDFPSCARNLWGKAFKLMHRPEVYEELSWDSTCSQQVIEGIKKVSKSVDFNFYSSFADSKISSFNSAFPNTPASKHYFTATEGHTSIVRAAKRRIVKSSTRFILGNNK